MGKAQRNKRRPPKHNPIIPGGNELNTGNGHGHVFDLSDDIPDNLTPANLHRLLEQLQSSSAEERDCACNGLALYAENPENVQILVAEGAVRILGPLMVDSSRIVRHAAAGALRNMTVSGGDRACQCMVDGDVMTPLVALLKRYSDQWQPAKKNPSNKIDTQTETFLEAVNLLLNLCEFSDVAVQVFNQEQILPILTRCLNVNVFGAKVSITVAQCLHTLSENNSKWKLTSLQNDVKNLLDLTVANSTEVGEHALTLLQVFAIGILINIHRDDIMGLPAGLGHMIELLTKVLQVDLASLAAKLSELISSNQESEEDEEQIITDDDVALTPLEGALQNVDWVATAQQTVLEIIANLCCDEDSDNEYEDVESDEESSQASMETESNGLQPVSLSLLPEVHEAIKALKTFNIVLSKASIDVEGVREVFQQHKEGRRMLKKLGKLQCRALLCLSNLVLALDPNDVGGGKALYDLWCSLGKLMFGSSEGDLLEATSTCMRSVMQRLASTQSDFVTQLQPSDLQILCQGVLEATETSVQVNLVQVLGLIGSMVSDVLHKNVSLLNSPAGEAVKVIGLCLLKVLDLPQKESSSSSDTNILWLKAEALDALFDVFKEDEVDQLAKEINLVANLSQFLPGFKRQVHGKRKMLGDNCPVVMTAKENLTRFIKYKSNS